MKQITCNKPIPCSFVTTSWISSLRNYKRHVATSWFSQSKNKKNLSAVIDLISNISLRRPSLRRPPVFKFDFYSWYVPRAPVHSLLASDYHNMLIEMRGRYCISEILHGLLDNFMQKLDIVSWGTKQINFNFVLCALSSLYVKLSRILFKFKFILFYNSDYE